MKSHFHCVYDLKYHLVLVTKYRKKCLNNQLLNYLETVFELLLTKHEIEIIEFNGESDHIHLLIKAHPSMQLSKLINNLKTVSSRYVRKNFEDHLLSHNLTKGLWTRAYYVSSVGGATIETIRNYIENQKRPNC